MASNNRLLTLYKNDADLCPLDFFLRRPITVLSVPYGLPLFLILHGSFITSDPGDGRSKKQTACDKCWLGQTCDQNLKLSPHCWFL